MTIKTQLTQQQQYGAQILLIHVNQPINPISPAEGIWIDNETAQQEIEQQLEQGGEELRSEGFQAIVKADSPHKGSDLTCSCELHHSHAAREMA